MAERGINVGKDEEVDIPWGADLQVGLSWDVTQKDNLFIDLDASAVLFNQTGVLLDAVYYNQLQTKDNSMIHSGDNKSGVGEGDDESITIISSLIHPTVCSIVIVVNAFKGGNFSSVKSAKVVVRDITHKIELINVNLNGSLVGEKEGVVLAMLYRNQFGVWRFRNVSKKTRGRNFQESEYKIRKVLKTIIPDYLMIRNWDYRSSSFNMEKNQTFVLPDISEIRFGLGWDVSSNKSIDLDASAISFDSNGHFVEDSTIYFGRKQNNSHSIIHSGDNLTGEGDGDDEQISVNLKRLPNEIKFIVFTVCIYTLDVTFDLVSNAQVRLVDPRNEIEICHYRLTDCGHSTALILSTLYKDGDEWRVEAVGDAAIGRTYRDLVDPIKDNHVKNLLNQMKANPRPFPIRIDFTVVEAKGLPAMDRSGTSDPYVYIITDQNEKLRTPYISKTLNPLWNKSFSVNGKVKGMIFEVWDRDLFFDDLIGCVRISEEELPFDQQVDIWKKVEPIRNGPGGGELHLRLCRVSNVS